MKGITLVLALVATTSSVPASIQAWAQAQGQPIVSTRMREHTDRDWQVSDGQYTLLSGKITEQTVSPGAGGGGTVYISLRYDFTSPRASTAAVKLLQSYSPQEALNILTAQQVNACLQAAMTMKAPKVRTILWKMLDPLEGRLLKVNCGVTATATHLTYEEKVIGDSYWKGK